MVHHAKNNDNEQVEVGWGLFPSSPEEIIECLSDEAMIVYQGELEQSQHLRIPIPLPDGIDCTWVHIKVNRPQFPRHLAALK
jgi:hypothetical protein